VKPNRRNRRKTKKPKGPDDFNGQSHLFQGAVVRYFAFQRSARTRSHHEVMILTGLGAAPTRSSGRMISVKTEIDPDRNTARQVVKRVKWSLLMFRSVNMASRRILNLEKVSDFVYNSNC
jgi:hypothetical protein